ncbi:transporter substrate-binding domain-containing protein [Vibrio sp. Of7-15]|uniref:substrate-binding periplasmic protein n=1 Tax=Vibrio sp. Of7-15 TaxID=2724879 RepID=UPI001EF2E10F|nr:transporter substrate-binding domain-containing protein [Vibrio sp. Of7-15]MCG7496659.1 transporter substrate-binding domain-containing protein [Vibrio sp. Of7-15]
MKRYVHWCLLFISLTFFPFCSITAATLTLAYADVESYPYQVGNGSKIPALPGLALDVINAAAYKIGIEVNYVRLPGKRVLQAIKSGKVDGGFIFSYNTQRAQYAKYPMKGKAPDSSKRIATLGYYFYKLKSEPLEWDGINLYNTKQKVGAHLGFSIVKELKKRKLSVHEVKTTAQLFDMLRSRRVAAIAIQNSIAQEYLYRHNLYDVEQIQPAIITKDYFLVLSHKFVQLNPILANQIWEVISAIRDDVISESRSKYWNR